MRQAPQVVKLALVRGAWTGLAFLSTLLIGRWFGATVAGTYFLSLSLVTILVTIAQLGLDLPVMRWTAVAHQKSDHSQVRAIARSGMLLTGAAGAALSAIAILLAPWVSSLFSDPALRSTFRIMALALVPWALALILARAFASVGRPIAGEVAQRLGFQAGFVTLIVVLVGLRASVTLAIAFAAAHWLVLLFALSSWSRTVPSSGYVAFDARALLRLGAPLLAASSTYLLVEWSDTVMVGYFLDPEAVGVYGTALRVGGTISVVLAVATSVAGPRFAAMYDKGDLHGLTVYARKVVRNCGYAALPMFLLLALAPGLIMGLFGPEFRAGSAVLVILASGQMANAAVGPLGVLLVMCGEERSVLHITLLAAATNVLLNVVLIPSLGIIGAAIATATSLVIVNGITMTIVSRRLGIQPFSIRAAAPPPNAH